MAMKGVMCLRSIFCRKTSSKCLAVQNGFADGITGAGANAGVDSASTEVRLLQPTDTIVSVDRSSSTNSCRSVDLANAEENDSVSSVSFPQDASLDVVDTPQIVLDIDKPVEVSPEWEISPEQMCLSRVEQWVSNAHVFPYWLDDEQTQSEVERPVFSSGDSGDDSEENKERFAPRNSTDLIENTYADMASRLANPTTTAIPLGMFGNLKILNLSGSNCVRIISGVLPKSLHSLDVSRNNIVVIEGLRDLSHLRVLNLSFNRISRIGNGLSCCTSLKELYLAGNKVSEVEGLHRLAKLVVLDLSFNKLATTKSLSQIAANYKALQALNLHGNAVLSNVGDEPVRRFVTGICPQLVYLNKHPLKSVSKDSKGSRKGSEPSRREKGSQPGTNRRGAKTKVASRGALIPVLTGQVERHSKTHHRSRSSDVGRVYKEPSTRGKVNLNQNIRPSEEIETIVVPRIEGV